MSCVSVLFANFQFYFILGNAPCWPLLFGDPTDCFLNRCALAAVDSRGYFVSSRLNYRRGKFIYLVGISMVN